ncbi:MAG: 4Fe-4S binding protein [Holosporales bacterium]|nr:4Fe-4S binding protein [Holosporales bacterium]
MTIKRILRVVLLKDILDALFVGLKCCFKKPVTKRLGNIERPDNFRQCFSMNPQKCVGCKTCSRICPSNALQIISPGQYTFNKEKCTYCGLCQRHCPMNAISFTCAERKQDG